jgi:cytochrome c-type biogenesis protein CcmH/NrfG
MLQSTSPRTSGHHRPPSLLAPAVVLCLFAGALPTQLAGRSSGITSEECLTLADVAPAKQSDSPLRLEQCSALYPDDAELMVDLGTAYEAIDRTKAELAYRRVLQLDPDYADVRLRLGRLLLARGAAAEAQQQAETALHVQPNRAALIDLRNEARLTISRTGP